MTDAESCKPQAKDGWTDAAGVTVKGGKKRFQPTATGEKAAGP